MYPIKHTILLIFILSFAFTAMTGALPLVSHAAFSLWQGTSCGGSGGPAGPCKLCDALIVAQNIVKYLYRIAIPIGVAMIIYGGIRLMLSHGSQGEMEKSKEVMIDALIGIIIVLASWAIINTVLHMLSGGVNVPWATITCPL